MDATGGTRMAVGHHLLPPPYRYLKVFISHATESKATAKYYARLLHESFFVWHFEDQMLPGQDTDVETRVAKEIEQSDYFLLLICDHSLSPEKPYCARELGLALQLQQKRATGGGMSERSPRPIIIPIYSKQMRWREQGEAARPKHFPVRDFWTNEVRRPYSFIGHDPHGPSIARTDEELLEFMKPRVHRVRRDIHSEREFHESGVFELYEALFPEKERDGREEIVDWALRQEAGQRHAVELPNKPTLSSWSRRIQFEFQMEALFYYVNLYGAPIAFSYLDYHISSGLIAGNYIAIGSGWRGSDLAQKFRETIETDIVCGYPEARGVLFEVEPVDFELLNAFSKMGRSSAVYVEKGTPAETQIRRLKRLLFYQGRLRASVYMDRATRKPIVYRGPCLDIEKIGDVRKEAEEEYWLMWYSPGGGHPPTWEEAVWFNCIEVQAKSMVLQWPNETGTNYWKYANNLVKQNIRHATGVEVALDRIRIREVLDVRELKNFVTNYGEIAI